MGIQTGFSYFSNSIQGIPGAGVDVNVETVDATPRYPLGYVVERADGNVFRYSLIGTATNSGLLVGPSTSSASSTYGNAVVIASASATAVQAEYPILPGQVGSHWVQVTLASISPNKFAGGYLMTTGGTGVGQTYRIIGNSATGTPTSTTLYIQLAEALQVALTATTGIVIVQSMFNDLAACATTATTATGVLMATTTTTNLYAWVQTHGPVGCLEDVSIAVTAGMPLVCSPITAGAYSALTTVAATSTAYLTTVLTQPIIGYSISPAGSGKNNRQGGIFLTLE